MAIPEVIPHILTPPELPLTTTSNSTDIYVVSQSGVTYGQERDTLLSSVAASVSNPIGAILMYGGASAPTGYLKCDWTAYDPALYPDLYAVIGYTYGNSAGNFRVPDFRGRVPIGVGTGIEHIGATPNAALTARVLGTFYGYETDTDTDTPTITTSNASLVITCGAVSVPYNLTPSGTVTVDNATLTVDFSNATIPPHEDVLTSDTHTHDVTTIPIVVTTDGVINVAQDSTYTTTAETVTVDLTGQPLTHSPTGTQDLTHGHTATFNGAAMIGTLTGSTTATVPAHSHPAASSAVSITVDIIQPSQCVNFIIKY